MSAIRKLSKIEKIILWSSIEDFADLSWLVGELKEVLCSNSQTEKRDIAKKVVEKLISEGLVSLYLKNLNSSFCLSSYIPVNEKDYKSILFNDNYWSAETMPDRAYIASTDLGEQTYYLN